MRERTRVELTALCQAYFAANGAEAQQAALQAVLDRAPLGIYYVRDEKGVPQFRLDVDDDGGIGLAKADREDRTHVVH